MRLSEPQVCPWRVGIGVSVRAFTGGGIAASPGEAAGEGALAEVVTSCPVFVLSFGALYWWLKTFRLCFLWRMCGLSVSPQLLPYFTDGKTEAEKRLLLLTPIPNRSQSACKSQPPAWLHS